MNASVQDSAASDPIYISTGHLPSPDLVQSMVRDAHERFRANSDGRNSDVYPALATVPAGLFRTCVVGSNDVVYPAGAADHEFTIISVSKPFVFALIC